MANDHDHSADESGNSVRPPGQIPGDRSPRFGDIVNKIIDRLERRDIVLLCMFVLLSVFVIAIGFAIGIGKGYALPIGAVGSVGIWRWVRIVRGGK